MSELPSPLTPADCDLREFHFMPLEVKRLLSSETWILGTGDERAAAITLWLESWHQVPAASLPSDDRMLAHLSQCKNWRKVKEHALRGWVKCADGKLYHPVVAEKALEAWISKLLSSMSGTAGNAKRWGIVVDTEAVKGQIIEAVRLLQAITPQSEWLRKKQVLAITVGSGGESHPEQKTVAPRHEKTSPPDESGIGPRSLNLSTPDRNREGERDRDIKTKGIEAQQHNHRGQSRALPDDVPDPPERHVQVAVLLRSLGVRPMTGSHPLAAVFANAGATDAQLRAAVDIARQRKPSPEPIPPGYLQPILQDILAPPVARPTATAAARDADRAHTIAVLTGRSNDHERTAHTFDVEARRVD
ncbi:hypothetical protein LMG10661_03345 [Ralstonia syzygii subsp. syzygii]|nr:hypothetical protein LMG10661_03345 [Ralstonia syzygii subsp. syzygii]